jgi:hypothetical protein
MAKKEYIKISREDAEIIREALDGVPSNYATYDLPLKQSRTIIEKALNKAPVIKLVDVKQVGKLKCFNCKKLFIPSVVLTFQIDKHNFCSSDCMTPHLPGPQD